MHVSAKAQRRLLLSAALLVLFLLAGFVFLPPVARTQLEKRLSITLGRQVTIERVRLNPCVFTLTVENLTVRESDSATPFLSWRRLYIDFDLLSSLLGEWVLSEVELDGLNVRGQINADHSLNISDLIAKFAPTTPAPAVEPTAKPPRPVRVVHLQVTDARVAFTDRSRSKPFTTTLAPLSIDVRELRSVGGPGAPARVSLTTEAGEKLNWSGTVQLAPFQTTGELKLEQIALPKYAPYYSDLLRAELTRGLLSVSVRHEINFNPAQRKLLLTGGAIQLRDLQMRAPDETQAAIELPALDALGLEADADALNGRLASLTLNGGQLRVRRDKDGAINLLSLLPPIPASSNQPPPRPTPPGPAAPDFTVLELALKDFQIEFNDLAAPRPAQFALHHVNVALKQLALSPKTTMPVQLGFDWAPRGKMQIDGQVSLSPAQAELKVVTTGLELLPFSPYLEQFVNARLTQGTLDTQLTARATLNADQPPAVAISGDLALEKLGLVDSTQSEDLAGIERLAVRGLQLTTTPELSVQLAELSLTAPHARTIIHPDHSINLLTLARAAPPANKSAATAAATPANAPQPKPAPRIEVGQVTISAGEFSFSDRSVTPRVNLAVKQLGGQLTGLSSTNPAKAELKLQASVDDSGPVAITGKLDLLRAQPSVALKVDLHHVDLVPLSPYSGKFAGYELARGQLKLDVALDVAEGKVDAKNVITLNQFTFGQAVESPDATKLPVRLGVALLKDIDGKIVIDVPVQGRTDDPDFRIGRVVLRVIVNLLTKAAVSPFSLLGAAFGGGEELAFQEFAPGSAELLPAEVTKLQKLTQALTQRPGLSVALEGNYDAAADSYALKRIKVTEKVRRAIWEQQHLKNPNIPPPEQLTITPAENAGMIKQLFDAAFPPGTQFGTPLPAAPPVLAPPPPPAGLFRRALATLTLSSQRAQRQTAQENARRQTEHAQAVASATAAGLPLDEMLGRLAEATVIEDHDLRALADARAQRVRAYLSDVGKIQPERLFLTKDNRAGETAQTGKGPRVSLQLQ